MDRCKKFFTSLKQHDASSSVLSSNLPNSNSSREVVERCTFRDTSKDDLYEKDEIKTLEDALRHFGLYHYLEILDSSLEELRRCRITDNEHEECFKQIDKEIMKLSNSYHPDTVMRRRGTEKEIKTAHNLQTALNSVRTVLNYLNAAFLADIRTDHKFQFYSKLNITKLCSEKEVKCRIYEMKFRLSMVSRIKQQNIILQIRKFLTESKMCVSSYIQDDTDRFKKLCSSVLFYLNECIEGFKKLRVELKEMEKQCKVQKDDHMRPFVENMLSDIKRDLKLLDLLEKSAKSSMNGNFQFFSTEEIIDPYFVRPLVWYTNVIIMCQAMTMDVSFWNNILTNIYLPRFNEFSELKPLFVLTAYHCGDNCYVYEVMKLLNKEYCCYDIYKTVVQKCEVIPWFRKFLYDIYTSEAIKFNVDHYTEVMTDDFLALELEKCASMMDEFEKKKQDLAESINEFRIKTEKMEEKYDDIVQTSKDLDSKMEEMVEANSQIDAILEENKSTIQELLEMSKKLRENSQ